jgi:aryl sulfotransferase
MLVRSPPREFRTWHGDSRQWESYHPRPGDIVIATYPKCGTTWMQQIVSSLVFQDTEARALWQISPWIESRFRGSSAEMFQRLEAQAHRRFVKTHLPADGLPIFDELQYIHVARDGRDTVMSWHNHLTGYSERVLTEFDQAGLNDPLIARPFPRIQPEPAEYFRQWISTPAIAGQRDGTPDLSYFDFEISYWAERARPNFLMVHYSDLLADLDAEMRRVAAFLGIAVNEAVWPSLVRAADFQEMRARGEAITPGANRLFGEGGVRRFFNNGSNGRWHGILTNEDLALYDTKVRERLSPNLAAWLEGGRRATGEPCEIAD